MKLETLIHPRVSFPIIALLASSAWLLVNLGNYRHAGAELAKNNFAVQNSGQDLRELQDHQVHPMLRTKEWELPGVEQVSAQLLRIETLAKKASLDLLGIHAPSVTVPGSQRYVLSAQGGADEICAFLVSVESEHRLLLIRDLAMTPAREAKIHLEVALTSYNKIAGDH